MRDARRDLARRPRWRRSRAAAVLVDPLDVAAIAAGIGEAVARRDELVPAGLARAREFTWERGRRRRRRAVAGARVRVVVFDADVLGRRRTGDETYVLNLLRELGQLAARRASGSSPSRAIRSSCRRESSPSSSAALAGAAHGLDAAARAAALGADLVPHAVRAPAAPAVPVRGHGARRVVRARPDLMGWKDRMTFRLVVPRAVRRAARVLTVSERTKADLVELYGVPRSGSS